MYQVDEISQWVMKANGAFLESAMRAGQVAAEKQGQMMKHQMVVMEKLMAAGNEQLALAKEARDGQEYFAKASEAATELGQTVATLTREAFELQAETAASVVSSSASSVVSRRRRAITAPRIARRVRRSGDSR